MTLLKTDDDKIYHLNESELIIIKEGEEDIKFGRVISQEQLDKEDLDWFSKQQFGLKQQFEKEEK